MEIKIFIGKCIPSHNTNAKYTYAKSKIKAILVSHTMILNVIVDNDTFSCIIMHAYSHLKARPPTKNLRLIINVSRIIRTPRG